MSKTDIASYELEHFTLKKGRMVKVAMMVWAESMMRGEHILWQKMGVGGEFVSTVFLGIDHMGAYFETMQFPSHNQLRSRTYEEAKEMHAWMCKQHSRRVYYWARCRRAGIPTHKRIRVMKKRLKA